jgi:hypothetical protein
MKEEKTPLASMPIENGLEIDSTEKKTHHVKAIGVVAGLLLMVAAVKVSSNRLSFSSLVQGDDSTVVTFSNEYTAEHGHPAADYRWVKEGYLVEPHRMTSVTIQGVSDKFDESKLTTQCSATHKQSNHIVHGINQKSVECTLVFKSIGDYTVDTSIFHSEKGLIHSAKTDVIARYVRRDLRKLNTNDLADYMNAARVMYDITREEGAPIYGTDYRDISYFAEIHLHNSVPDKHNDRLHDGMGFITQHVSLTNEYEAALQAINPRVALPYWDFTQDLVMIREMAKTAARKVDYSDLWKLDIWGDDYFGRADTALHTVTSGRWAYTRISNQVDENKAFVDNPYGFMRAPWNLNSSPYLTRFHKACGLSLGNIDSDTTNQWPSCEEHHFAVFDISQYAYFVGYMSYSGHGGVHRMIGGSNGDCDQWRDLQDVLGPKRVKNMQEYSTFLGRFTYRKSYCSMPLKSDCIGTAGGNGDSNTCIMDCAGCDDGFTKSELENLASMFSSFDDASKTQKEIMVREVFCEDKIILGDHIESSSASDVSFWPIHPTLERLLIYKQLVNPLTDYTWDGGLYYPFWSSLCMWGLDFNTECTGHGQYDVTVGRTTVFDEDIGDFTPKYINNWDLVQLWLPRNTWKLSYVYETFDYKHCEKDGIVFKKIPKGKTDDE